MNTLLIILIVLAVVSVYISFVLFLLSPNDHPWFFKFALRKYQKKDRVTPPAHETILFTGSSIMKYWKTLDEDLAPLPVLNRALAGARITEIAFFVDRLINPYKPKAVVLYAGSNDIQGRKPRTAEQVLMGFRLFVDRIHSDLPDTRVYFISINPTPARIRWKHWTEIQKANLLIQDYCDQNAKLYFIDITKHFLNNSGKPKRELFKIDGIHMNSQGYDIWTTCVKPLLK